MHVNGKPNNMMSNNPTEVLRSMPANSIKSIEVITEPGAKYDAEGVAGILNIITIGAGMEGYTVTLNGGASNMRVYGGGYGTVQSGKFTVTGNYSYNYQGSQKDLKIHIVRISRLRKINFWSRIEEARAMAIFNLAVWKEVMRLTL